MPERIVRRVEHGAELTATLDQIAAQIPAEVAEAEEDDARVVLKIHATTRLDNGPFAKLQFTPLGEGEDWTYYVLSSRESRELLISVLSEYSGLPDGKAKDVDWTRPKSWAAFLDHIDGIELFGASDRADPTLAELDFDPVATVDCLLWPAGNERIALDRVNSILTTIAEASTDEQRVHVAAVDARPDRTMIRVVATRQLVDELLENVDVERVRAPLSATVTQSAVATATMPSDIPDSAETAIGVVDGVVNVANPLTGSFVLDSAEFPAGHIFSGGDAHGTGVAGAAIWGDLDQLVTTGTLPAPHPVVSARVLDFTAANTYSVTGLAHTTIEAAIRWLVAEHGVRIVNLSINFPVAATTPLRDELTFTIDTLVRELGIVVVVSAGNRTQLTNGHWLNDFPGYLEDTEARIAAPGDAALVVTVGSHAARDVPAGRHAASKIAIAAAQQPSPFTRVGPVRGIGSTGMMKPEFSHHGGNWSWDHLTGSRDVLEPGTAAVVAIAPITGRILGSATGTSYAAPAVAHEVARIADRYPVAGANLLRALTALSARAGQNPVAGINAVRLEGYGQPDAERVLESSSRRVFLTYEGTTPVNRVLVHRLPIPAEFADGVRERTFRVALAFDPPVRRGRREYIAGTMSVELVRGLTLQDVQEIYARQPTVAAAAADPTLVRLDLPEGVLRPSMHPGVTALQANTLIRRDLLKGAWDPDHGDYFLIVAHNQSAWTAAQRNSYTEQTYALAVEIAEETESSLDLYSAIRAQLRGRLRLR